MAPSVPENLTRIHNASIHLNRIADEATAQIKAIDGFLRAASPGVSFWLSGLPLQDGRETNSNHHRVPATWQLGYDRSDDGDFAIVVRCEAEMTEGDGTRIRVSNDPSEGFEVETIWVRPLAECSRALRIAAIEHLPALVEQMATSTERLQAKILHDVEATTKAIAELRDAAKQLPPPVNADTATKNRKH